MTVSIFVPRTESPIETAFVAAIAPRFFALPALSWKLTAQESVAQYRADFALRARFRAHVFRVAVECDGHDYHGRTADQAQRDRSRDREFVRLGWTPLRFTGRELVRDAGRCADEVIEVVLLRALDVIADPDWPIAPKGAA